LTLILKVDMRRYLLPIVGTLALVAAAYAIRVAAARSTGQSAPPGGDNSPVIRFVKDPEMAPPVPDHDISGAITIVMATQEVIAAYGGVPALPTTFVIDTQGRVVTKHAGLHPIETYYREIRALLGQPVDARIETFADTGQVFLKNAANATELPGVNLTGLTPAQKKAALHRLNAESCTCGCQLTLSQCRVNDTECPVSGDVAAKVVEEVVHAGKRSSTAAPKASKSPKT
jgi:hypothetical protein